jgi:hypothetical protein
MSEQDRPPEHIWQNEKELEAHFERVRDRYKDKRDGSASDTGWEEVPDLAQNELTKGLRRK